MYMFLDHPSIVNSNSKSEWRQIHGYKFLRKYFSPRDWAKTDKPHSWAFFLDHPCTEEQLFKGSI